MISHPAVARSVLFSAALLLGGYATLTHSVHLSGSVTLTPGFNLVGIPVDTDQVPDLMTLIMTLGDPPDIAGVSRFSPDTGRFEWCRYEQDIPTGEGCAQPVVPGEGWLVEAKRATSIVYPVDLPCPALSLKAGLNVIAFPCAAEGLTAYTFLKSVGDPDTAANLQALDAETGRWRSCVYQHDEATGEPAGEDFPLEAGTTYLVGLHQDRVAILADADGDGLSDDIDTYPNQPDSDGDGLLDGAEFHIHRTNPLVGDSDGDGISDGDEIAAGTDPLDDIEIRLISPRQEILTTGSDVITLEIDATGIQELSVTVTLVSSNWEAVQVSGEPMGITVRGVRNIDRFFVFNVPLSFGNNRLLIHAVNTKGNEIEHEITVISDQPHTPVRIIPAPEIAEAIPVEVAFRIVTEIPETVTELLIDDNGDGVIDATVPASSNIRVTYDAVGRYNPVVTIPTSNNLLFSSSSAETTPVTLLEPSVPDPTRLISDLSSDITDLEYDPSSGHVFALSGTDRLVTVLDTGGNVIQIIPLIGVMDPQGIGVGPNGDLFVADTGNHRIIKLLASTGFSPDTKINPDGAFGTYGTGNGEFQSPQDVAAGTIGWAEQIYVADTDNARIQSFGSTGKFETAFNGADSPDGALIKPVSIVSDYDGVVVIIDKEGNSLRVFNQNGTSVLTMGTEGAGLGQLLSPTKVTHTVGGFIVTDSGNKRAQVFVLSGEIKRIFAPLGFAPAAVVRLQSELGYVLFVAPEIGRDISVIVENADPPGETPLEVVQAFLLALADQDLNNARMLVLENRRGVLDSLEGDSQGLSDMASKAGAVRDLTLRKRREFTAAVKGVLNVEGEIEPVGFVLHRDPSDNKWKLANY